MTNHLWASRRSQPRRPIAINLGQILKRSAGGAPVNALARDVSRNGLGVIAFEELPAGTKLALVVGDKSIELKVMWCKADGTRAGIFHAGLATVVAEDAVDQTLEDAKLIPPVGKA